MKFDQLSYFYETAKQEHIGKASKALGISPSAISHSITSLEEELGRELFLRKGKNISLSAHGRLLMEKVGKILLEMNSIKEEMSAEDIELEGNYKLAGTHPLVVHLLLPAWMKLQESNPRLTSEISSLRSAEVVSSVLQGQVDLGLCFSPLQHPQLESKILHIGQLYLAVKKNHPVLKIKKEDQLKALQSYSCVLPRPLPGIEVCESHPALLKAGLRPKLECSFDHYEVGLHKVANSLSWGLFPQFLLDLNLSSHKESPAVSMAKIHHPQNWEAPYSISLIWQKGKILPMAIKRLIASFQAEA